jgi:enoyl-CoA hydratase/carnithine racemase
MVALSRNVPRKQAFEMLTTGEFIDATRAREIGLVNRVVAPEDQEAETRALAETVASKLASAVRIGKQAFYEQIQMPLDAAYAFTGDVMTHNMMNEDTSEGIQAFIEKRKPDWPS